MAQIQMGSPCLGKSVKLPQQPNATILLVALSPGASAGMACVRWTNPAAGPAQLPPLPSLELVDLRALPQLANAPKK